MAKDSKKLISAIIITKNEEKSIAFCLESIKNIVDEIIVLDSFSTDNTPEICKSFGVRFVQQAWEGYAQTKNKANKLASHNWILSLDADEVLSPELQKSILALKNSDQDFFYKIGRITNYCGKWIRHGGWYPDVKIRLFDRRKAEWQGEFVHEKLIIQEDVKTDIPLLNGDCYHYSYHSIAQHVQKVNHFSTLAAQDMYSRGKKFSLFKLVLSPWARFMSMYFIKRGFLDGKFGFIIAIISAFEKFLRIAKLYQLQREK
jgi:glycosyltransferase involved in cell wall biosynthesis